MIPALAKPKTTCITPARTMAASRFSKLPRVDMALKTIAASPAAGPLTPSGDLLIAPTTTPPIMPAITPENKGAPLASAIPKQSGNATKKTTTLAGISALKFLKGLELFICNNRVKHA